jgi:hypothetical protein
MPLKHQQAIEEILTYFHESWMNAEDKAEMNRGILKSFGGTMGSLDARIETGIRNGYSVKNQLALCRCIVELAKAHGDEKP